MAEISQEVYSGILDMLKDISNYLAKQDSEQKKVELEDTPKAKETQDPIVNTTDPAKEAVKKEYVPESLDEKDKTEEELPEDKEDKDEDEDKDSSEEELKSLLKDIRNALVKQNDVSELVKAEVKKSMPSLVKVEADKMLRKMGFTPTRPDIRKVTADSLGLDKTQEVKKSEDIVKSEDKEVEDGKKIVEDLSKKSFLELGTLREKMGDFRAF